MTTDVRALAERRLAEWVARRTLQAVGWCNECGPITEAYGEGEWRCRTCGGETCDVPKAVTALARYALDREGDVGLRVGDRLQVSLPMAEYLAAERDGIDPMTAVVSEIVTMPDGTKDVHMTSVPPDWPWLLPAPPRGAETEGQP